MLKARGLTIRCLFLITFLTAPILSWGNDNAPLQIRGSKYMFFAMTDLARAYMQRNPDKSVVVDESDHEALKDLSDKKYDAIAMLGKLDEDAQEEAEDLGLRLVEQIVGWGAVTLVTHPKNPVTELTLEQVRRIFSGEYNNWNQVGGDDELITTMTRDESVSGTELFFSQSVLRGFPFAQKTVRVFDHDIVRKIWKQPGSVADSRYTEAIRGRINGFVKIIAIKNDENSPAVMPTPETIQSQAYPLAAPMTLYFNSSNYGDNSKRFVSFCSSRGLLNPMASRRDH
ncbi:PstS family phosphate ABC transporter substrate-binding protein [Desulfomonile tiedjei]|uniref:ABC-type phosphate transport system, periplasmic component n=1 Tax=Desulfomonile tiedjei (strain ATCC 49306 / DSM 6799 / DCB-1) TaxID=706587 RepID=I4C0W2_DESTA|nr:substrate-binding domain-containing protein [Desulfomonile tiedjei]AFM23203.1 ABC-type phosphate transport system, periplasmic component [Desulfomonile tiedjei DSM 6799]